MFEVVRTNMKKEILFEFAKWSCLFRWVVMVYTCNAPKSKAR